MAEKVVKALNLNITYTSPGTVIDQEMYHAPFIVQILAQTDSLQRTDYTLTQIDNRNVTITYTDRKRKEEVSKMVAYDHPFVLKEIGVLKIVRNPDVRFIQNRYKFSITPIDVVAARLQKQISVSVTNKLVTTINISMDHSIPQMGEDILNKFIEGYMQQSIIEKNRIADSTISFIDKRLLLVSEELGDVEGDIQKFKQHNEIADIGEQSRLLVGNTSEYAKELSELQTKLSIVEALMEYLSEEGKNKRVVPNSVLVNDVVFGNLVESYNAMLLERDRQLLTSTEENPFVKNLDQQLKGIRDAMLSNLNTNKNSLLITQRQLEKKLSMLGGEIHKVPANERVYLGMFRQQTLKQELYLFLLKKREETAVSKTSNFSNAKIIDYPKSEFGAHSPNTRAINMMGFSIGMILPILLIYLIDFLNNRVQSKEDVTKAVSVPIVGEIGFANAKESFIYENPRSVISEQFRGLRTNLSFYMNSSDSAQTFLLTSSTMGEGKTFTSINLATILAISGKKVILVDLDLRRGSLSDKLHLKNQRGFTNYVIDKEVKISDVIIPSGFSKSLFFLTCGPYPPNPSETLMHERADELIKKLQEEYDYVILDAPPIGMVTDAQLLDKYASISLYLVRQDYTLKSHLGILQDLSKNKKLKKLGVVLNDIRNTKGSTYTYGYYAQDMASKKTGWMHKLARKFKWKG
jgi:capsular exopolysaccharide synthesis family protein